MLNSSHFSRTSIFVLSLVSSESSKHADQWSEEKSIQLQHSSQDKKENRFFEWNSDEFQTLTVLSFLKSYGDDLWSQAAARFSPFQQHCSHVEKSTTCELTPSFVFLSDDDETLLMVTVTWRHSQWHMWTARMSITPSISSEQRGQRSAAVSQSFIS